MYTLLIIIGVAAGVALILGGGACGRRGLLALGVLLLLATAGLFGWLEFWGEYLWFDAVGHGQRFWTVVEAMTLCGAAGALVGGVCVALLTLPIPRRRRPTRHWPAAVGAGVGLVTGFVEWQTVLAWWHGVTTGDVDPILGRDTGFYLFALPLLDVAHGLLLTLALVGLVAAVVNLVAPRDRSEVQLSMSAKLPRRRDYGDFRPRYVAVGALALVAPVSEFTGDGLPDLLSKDLPPEAAHESLEVDRPEIYYGTLTDTYAVGNSAEKEFDYPRGDDNVYTRYAGDGGVPLEGWWRKFVYGWKLGGTRLLFSGYPRAGSRIMFHRDVRERVRTLTPFLRFDSDPYAVLSGGAGSSGSSTATPPPATTPTASPTCAAAAAPGGCATGRRASARPTTCATRSRRWSTPTTAAWRSTCSSPTIRSSGCGSACSSGCSSRGRRCPTSCWPTCATPRTSCAPRPRSTPSTT